MIKIEKFNESFLRVFSDDSTLHNIKEFFTFKAPGYRWHPKYKAKLWSGDISLFNMQTNKLPLGLHDLLLTYAEKAGEEVEYIYNPKYTDFGKEEISYDELVDFIGTLQVTNSEGLPITPKDYQIDAVYTALVNRRRTLSMPTGSGKSLTIYIIIRWMLAHDKRVCLLVPSVSLVKQMISDFIEYSIGNGFDIDSMSTLLFSGQERNFDPPILISTWQTISKMIKLSHGMKVLNSYDGIIIDECHTAKGTELQKILDLATDVPYKIGTTGTVDKEKINELSIVGALGPIEKIITTKELMDSGSLSDMIIKGIILQYPEETCKLNKSLEYQDELSFICAHNERSKIIANLAFASTGTTMIMCNFIDKHLIPLYEYIKSRAEKYGREVYMIHGGISADERERIRKYAIANPGIILVVSYATCQAGINIPNIENVIFGSPSKSMIRVLQSIGRGLRKVEGKKMTLIDIVDDMRYKKYENTIFKHFLERMKIYRIEKFDIELKEIQIK
jgi:superfamily II DNA or RNA helicase